MEERGRCLALAAASALLLCGVGWPAAFGWIYTARDLGDFHVPTRHFLARCLAQGESFLWFPEQFCGFYLHGEGQAGLFHPLHQLLYRLPSFALAFDLNLVACYAAALVGACAWLRRLALPRDAALLGAVAFAFSGYSLLHFLHLNALEVVAHVPWLLLAIDVALRSPDPRRAALANAAVTLLVASALLMGHPQYALFAALACAGWALLRLPGAGAARPFALALAAALGAGAGAIQWLPTLETLRASARAEPTLGFLGAGSLHPAQLLQLVAPYLVDESYESGRRQAYGVYNGAATTLLALWAGLRLRHLGSWRLPAAAALLLAALSLLLATGEHNPLFPYYARLPLLDRIRAPHRFVLLAHLASAPLVAIGFADLCARARAARPTPWRALAPLLAVPVAAIAVALGAAVAPRLDPAAPFAAAIATGPRLALGALLLCAASALVLAAARGAKGAPLAIAALLAADLAGYGLSYLWKEPPRALADFVASRPAPPEPTAARVLYLDARTVARRTGGLLDRRSAPLSVAGLRLANGHAALESPRRLDYRRERAQRVAGVDWVRRWPARWERVPDPLPRVRLVARAQVSRDEARDLERVDPETTALVARELSLGGGAPGRAAVLEERPGVLRVETRAPARQLLVYAESFHPGWVARLDGAASPVERVYGDFMGAAVPAGEHVVELRFEPADLRRGARISLVALALAAAQLAAALLLARRGSVAAERSDRLAR